jgi:hypothetical protein
MQEFDEAALPAAAGMHNPGAQCYLNATLQCLLTCTAVVTAVLGGADQMRRTPTGAAVLALMQDARAGAPGAGAHTAGILDALLRDLAARRPAVRFGRGQESASEVLHMLTDMTEPEGAPGTSPLARALTHRTRGYTRCDSCRAGPGVPDEGVVLNLFHLPPGPEKPGEFSAAVARHESPVADAVCHCGAPATRRVYDLTLAPSVLVCALNAYGAREDRALPATLRLCGVAGAELTYRLVAHVEHRGSLGGGHYWAHALRREGSFALNDAGVTPAPLRTSRDTYMAYYHFAGASSPGS